MNEQKVTLGRIVHFVIGKDSWGEPLSRPAMVVQVWQDGTVNLQVFTDGQNDVRRGTNGEGMLWKGSVDHNEEKTVGTWHWPPRV